MEPRRVSENRATRSRIGQCLGLVGDVLGWVLVFVIGSFKVLGAAIVFGIWWNALIASGRTGGAMIVLGAFLLVLNLYASAFVLNKSGYSRNWIFWRFTPEAPVGEALMAAGVAWVYFTVFFSGLSCFLYRIGLIGTNHPVKSGSLM